MLVINKAVHAPHLQSHSLCHLQMCLNSGIANEVPKFLSRRPDGLAYELQVINSINDAMKEIVSYFSVSLLIIFV